MENGGFKGSLSRSPYDIVISKKTVRVVKKGREEDVSYWEGSWEVPREIRRKPRHKITGSSRTSEMQARERTVAKVLAFLEEWHPGLHESPTKPRKKLPIEIDEKPDRTVQSFLEEWFNAQVESNRWQLSTKNGIEQKFKDYIFPYLGAIKLDDLTTEQVRKHFTLFLPNLKKLDKSGRPTNTNRLAASAIRQILQHFHMAIRAARAKNWIETDPAYQIPLPSEPVQHSDDDTVINLMDALIEAFLAEPDMDDPETIRVAIAFFMGLRRGERCGLRFQDIRDLDGKKPEMVVAKQLGYISTNKGGDGHFLTASTKTGRPRKIPIPAPLIPYLKHQRAKVARWKESSSWKPKPEYEDLVLIRENGDLIGLNQDSRLINKWFVKHGVNVPGASAGDIRHASATWWVVEHELKRPELKKMFGWTKESEMDMYYARTDLQPLAQKAKNATLKRRNSG